MQLNLPPRLLRIIIGCIITSVILVVSIALLIPSRHFDPASPPSSNSETKTWFPLLQQKPSWTTEQLEPKFAYAQYATNLDYLCNAIINFSLLRMYGASHDLVLIFPKDWSEGTSEQAKAIDNIRSKHPHIHLRPMDVISTSKGDATWRDSLTKFQSFSLTEWTRILAFDSDSLVLNTMDHYFLSPMAPLAVPRAYWLNEKDSDIAKQVLGSHVMLLEPSKARYDKIIKEALQSGEFDMEVINHMFRDSAMILPHRRLALLTGEFRAKNHSQYLAPDEDEEWNAMAERPAAPHFVAFPQAPPTWSPKKYPLVAYAHGTIGLYKGCAPSAGPGLFDYKSWSLITQRGYAVVATDYARLGNNYTDHKYCTYPAHANDVYYSVVAAKKAFYPKLSNEWVSVGHSQGGSTVWKLAVKELRSSKGSATSGKYVGTVSISPGPKIRDIVYWSINNVLPKPNYRDYVVTAELLYVTLALKRFSPSFNISRIVAPALQKRLELAESIPDLLSDAKNQVDDNDITKWQDRTSPVSGGVATEPLMVVQGLGDTSVVLEKTIEAYREACKNKDYEVHLRLYSLQDHSATVVSSSAEWFDWVQDRFAGKGLVVIV
ncbi:hypothetical protein BFJ69_g12795 [Fusarium oxysporum]|uniref:Uncharacterized protein n=1 Tax=Fusarium oxysporum TaxID=5507 RepID=A0A420MMT1_FUSOX|nr:hypothetical protein BFJ69_g12795 [Fusarium oxysporum]